MGFLQKLRIVTLGAANDLLDKAVDMNSPSALRQYVRDLEDAIGKMNSELAVQEGGLRSLKREYGDLGAKIASEKNNIKTMMATNPDGARARAAIVLEEQKHFDNMGNDINNQQAVIDQLQKSSENLQAKHDLMVSRVRELERLDRDTKTKQAAAHANDAANAILGLDSSKSIDDVEDRMRRQNDVASAAFDRSMAAGAKPDETNSADVDALLASLK